MSRPPRLLDWRPAAPSSELDTVLDALAAQGLAYAGTLVRAVALLSERVDALERAAPPATAAAEWLTPTAAAARYGYHPDSISRWARQGRVRSLGHGSGRRVAVADLEVLARHRGGQ